jgi:hypothetical protein
MFKVHPRLSQLTTTRAYTFTMGKNYRSGVSLLSFTHRIVLICHRDVAEAEEKAVVEVAAVPTETIGVNAGIIRRSRRRMNSSRDTITS